MRRILLLACIAGRDALRIASSFAGDPKAAI